MSGWSVRIPRRILNADYALPVGHLPRGTYPPSRATNPALATPLWTAKPSQRRETYPRHGSLRPAGDGGQYTLPGELSIFSPPGSLLPVISLRCPAVLISHYYCRYYLKSLCPNYVRVDFQSRCNWVPVFYKERLPIWAPQPSYPLNPIPLGKTGQTYWHLTTRNDCQGCSMTAGTYSLTCHPKHSHWCLRYT